MSRDCDYSDTANLVCIHRGDDHRCDNDPFDETQCWGANLARRVHDALKGTLGPEAQALARARVRCRDVAHDVDRLKRPMWCPLARELTPREGAAYPDGRCIGWLRICRKTGSVVVHNKQCVDPPRPRTIPLNLHFLDISKEAEGHVAAFWELCQLKFSKGERRYGNITGNTPFRDVYDHLLTEVSELIVAMDRDKWRVSMNKILDAIEDRLLRPRDRDPASELADVCNFPVLIYTVARVQDAEEFRE